MVQPSLTIQSQHAVGMSQQCQPPRICDICGYPCDIFPVEMALLGMMRAPTDQLDDQVAATPLKSVTGGARFRLGWVTWRSPVSAVW